MTGAPATLSTPVLLLAMPQVLDPFFHRSVVLLVRHGDEGSLGFIVNRPTGIKVNEILKGMEGHWQVREAVVADFGGPVQLNLGSVLFCPHSRPPADPPRQAPAAPANLRSWTPSRNGEGTATLERPEAGRRGGDRGQAAGDPGDPGDPGKPGDPGSPGDSRRRASPLRGPPRGPRRGEPVDLDPA